MTPRIPAMLADAWAQEELERSSWAMEGGGEQSEALIHSVFRTK